MDQSSVCVHYFLTCVSFVSLIGRKLRSYPRMYKENLEVTPVRTKKTKKLPQKVQRKLRSYPRKYKENLEVTPERTKKT